jgi:hypothetical protein
MNAIKKNQTFHDAKRFFARCSWLLVLLMLAGIASIQAQQTTGAIVGTVKDSQGALVTNA